MGKVRSFNLLRRFQKGYLPPLIRIQCKVLTFMAFEVHQSSARAKLLFTTRFAILEISQSWTARLKLPVRTSFPRRLLMLTLLVTLHSVVWRHGLSRRAQSV